MKKVLMVSYSFPPKNTPLAIRLGKLTKYLPEFGWEPTVLTAKIEKGADQSLPIEIDEANIIRVPPLSTITTTDKLSVANKAKIAQARAEYPAWKKLASKLYSSLYPVSLQAVLKAVLPDPQGWYRHAVSTGRQILNENKVDAIFSSYSPSAAHFVASRLQSESGLPWIAEFRDPWSLNPYARNMRFIQFLTKKVERRVIKNSSLLVDMSEESARQLQKLHSKQVIVIPNGFDEEDYAESVPLTSKFTITYTGSVYRGKRDPTPLFEALKPLREQNVISPDNFEARFFGGSSLNIIFPAIKECNLDDVVKIYDYIPFRESVTKQKESTALLLLSWNDPRDKGTLTGKVYEYIGAGRPIMAIAFRGGEIDKLLARTGSGILTTEPEEIRGIILKWLEEFRQSGDISSYYRPREEVIKQYTRREQARQLAQALDEVITLK